MKHMSTTRTRLHGVLFLLLAAGLLCACTSDSRTVDQLFRNGKMYEQDNQPDSALYCYMKAYREATHGTDTAQICRLLYSCGELFYNHLVYDKAIITFQKGLEYAQRLSDKSLASEAMRGIGKCHYVRREYQQALEWFVRARKQKEEILNAEERSSVCNNLANVYLEMEQYPEALACCDEAIRLTTDSIKIYRDYTVKGRVFTLMQQYDSALHYLRLAALSDNPRTQASVYFKLAALPRETGISDSLKFIYLDKAQLLADSIESNNQPAQLTESYVLASMEELEGQSRYRLFWSGSLLLVIIGVGIGLLLLRYQRHLRVHRNRIDNLMAANKQLETAMVRNQEENQLGLLKSTGETCYIHFAQTPTYRELKQKLLQEGVQLSYKEQDQLQAVLQKTYAPFLSLLTPEISLSANDLMLCCLALSRFSTKECAACRGVSSETIRSQKTRIKKKLQESPLGNELFQLIFSD